MTVAHILPNWLWSFQHWFVDPGPNGGYGIGSSWAGATAIFTGSIAAFVTYWHHHECHVEAPKNCHRRGHPVPGTGNLACREHHPHAEPKGATTAADILRHHEESGA